MSSSRQQSMAEMFRWSKAFHKEVTSTREKGPNVPLGGCEQPKVQLYYGTNIEYVDLTLLEDSQESAVNYKSQLGNIESRHEGKESRAIRLEENRGISNAESGDANTQNFVDNNGSVTDEDIDMELNSDNEASQQITDTEDRDTLSQAMIQATHQLQEGYENDFTCGGTSSYGFSAILAGIRKPVTTDSTKRDISIFEKSSATIENSQDSNFTSSYPSSLESRMDTVLVFDRLLPDTQVGEYLGLSDYLDHSSPSTIGISKQRSIHPIEIQSQSQTTSCSSSVVLIQHLPLNRLSCKERKRIVVYSTRPAKITQAMKDWYFKVIFLLDPFLEEDECWLHPSPPPPNMTPSGSLRPYGKIQKAFQWHDRYGRYTIVLNYGIVRKLLYDDMTEMQKDGFVQQQWHLSHLCGNWTCLNPDHTTVEPGTVNVSRNNCFSHRGGCRHEPKCMKERKLPLGADGKFHTGDTPILDAGEFEEEWVMHNFDEDEDMMEKEEMGSIDYDDKMIAGEGAADHYRA